MKTKRWLWLTMAVLSATPAAADEPTRRVEEELRQRNLYFGDVDGRMTPELRAALKRYQERKNLDVTGEIDEVTARSLNVAAAVRGKAPVAAWPDVPVLRSDAARDLPPTERVALQGKAGLDPVSTASIPPPAESPTGLQDLTPKKITEFVERYLRDAESDDVSRQVGYYTFPVNYFDHGVVDAAFVTRDTGSYVKRWPKRHYELTEPVVFAASENGEEAQVQFTIAFKVERNGMTVSGKTRNFWTLKAENPENLKISGIYEQRLHE